MPGPTSCRQWRASCTDRQLPGAPNKAPRNATPPFALTCLSLLLAACTPSDAPDITIVAQDFRFVPAEVRAKADQTVHLLIRNEGREPHVFASHVLTAARIIDGSGAIREVETVGILIPSGKTVEVEFQAPAGTYAFHCARRGHGGMEGLLIVESAI